MSFVGVGDVLSGNKLTCILQAGRTVLLLEAKHLGGRK